MFSSGVAADWAKYMEGNTGEYLDTKSLIGTKITQKEYDNFIGLSNRVRTVEEVRGPVVAAALGTWLGLSIQNAIPKGVTPEKYYDIKINTTGANSKLLNALESSYGIKYGVEDIFGTDYLNYRNTTLDTPRTGSALKYDNITPILDDKGSITKEFPSSAQAHGFNKLVDNSADYAVKFNLDRNATLYQLEGSLNNINGRFEWIIQDGQLTHRMFIKGGEINGIPIKK